MAAGKYLLLSQPLPVSVQLCFALAVLTGQVAPELSRGLVQSSNLCAARVQVCVRLAQGAHAQTHLGLHARLPALQLQASHLQLADARRMAQLLQLWAKHSRYAHLRPPGYSRLRQHTAGPRWPNNPPQKSPRTAPESDASAWDSESIAASDHSDSASDRRDGSAQDSGASHGIARRPGWVYHQICSISIMREFNGDALSCQPVHTADACCVSLPLSTTTLSVELKHLVQQVILSVVTYNPSALAHR